MCNHQHFIIGMLILVMIMGAMALEAKTWKIGVLAKRGVKQTMSKWLQTSLYLNENIPGEEFIITPLSFEDIRTATRDGSVDFVLTNSSFYVELNAKYGAQAIATMVNTSQGKQLKEFGGVIFTYADSPINTLADVKGKRFAAVNPSSFGGFQMGAALLRKNGIDYNKDFSQTLYLKTHDAVVFSVKNKEADVGTVRTDTLERMETEGKIKMSDFKILNPMSDDFPFARSTRLFPEWPMAKTKNTPNEIADKVKKALLEMPADSEAAKSAKIAGWIAALDYEPVLECLRSVGLDPTK